MTRQSSDVKATPAIQPGDVFLMNPDNRWFLEGKVQRPSLHTKGTGCLLVFLIPFVLVGLYMIVEGWSALHTAV